MSIPETVLTFVGAPAAIVAVVAIAVLGPGQMRGPVRYRPGRPWDHAPAWFVPHPAEVTAAAPAHGALASSHTLQLAGADAARTVPVGGASGEW